MNVEHAGDCSIYRCSANGGACKICDCGALRTAIRGGGIEAEDSLWIQWANHIIATERSIAISGKSPAANTANEDAPDFCAKEGTLEYAVKHYLWLERPEHGGYGRYCIVGDERGWCAIERDSYFGLNNVCGKAHRP